MSFEVTHIVGPAPYFTNTFLIACPATGQAMVIDPAAPAADYLEGAQQAGCQVGRILLTHQHDDHTGAVEELRRLTGAPVLAFEEDTPYYGVRVDRPLTDRERIPFGEGEQDALTVLHTPGHTPGSCCFWAGDLLFAGDTLFAGSVGRTDLPGGSWDTLRSSLKKLCAMELPALAVLPGHGPFTDLATEKKQNGYLRF